MIAPQELSQQQRSSSFWWMVLLSTAAFAAALWASWHRPVWHDELYTLYLARMSVADLIEALRMDSGPPLHYLLCHLLFLLVGWQEGSNLGTFMVRLPSVLAFAALPLVVWRGTRQLPAARFWGPLLAVSWLPMLYFATEARAYALLALVNGAVWILGPIWVERGGKWTAGFAALAASLPLLHYTGLVSLVMLPALAFFVGRCSRFRLLLAVAAATAPILIWSPVMLSAPPQSMAWVDTTAGPGRPGLSTLAVLSPAGPYPDLFELEAAPVPAWASLILLGGVIAGAGIGAVRRKARQPSTGSEQCSAATLAFALLPGAALALSVLAEIPVYFAGRTESLIWIPAVTLAVVLLAEAPLTLRRGLVGAYVAVGLVTIGFWMTDLPSRPPAVGVEVGQQLAWLIEEGDRVVVIGLWQLEVRHGLAIRLSESGQGTSPIPDVETLPRSQSQHPGWFDLVAATELDQLHEATELGRQAAAEGGRLWLVWSPALPVDRTILPAFPSWQRDSVVASPVIAVNLLTPPPRTP